jgi:hypothetical protein
MDRKASPWRPVRLRWERLRDFSDSLSETVWKFRIGTTLGSHEWLKRSQNSCFAALGATKHGHSRAL